MQSEIWKDVPGYSGLYQVSNLGRIKSLERIDANKHLVRERILKQFAQYDLSGNFIRRYDSILDAKIKNGIRVNNGSLNACLKDKQKTAYNYVWKYA